MTKYALLIGINYKGKKYRLKGCINDINDIKLVIKAWGYTDENIIMMHDEQKDKSLIPTGFNINQQLNMFCSKLKPGDKAIIYYSGHGTRVKSKGGSNDCCLVPLDYEKVGMIKDDTIRYYMYKIPADVNVFCAFDACNSGSVCDLKYSIYETSYRKDITKKLKNYDYREWNKRQIVKFQENYSETSANIVSFSGCSDDQYSYEMGRNSALTTAMLKVLKACGPDVKLEDLILHLRGTILVWRLKQSPGMTSGKNLDMTKSLSEFIM